LNSVEMAAAVFSLGVCVRAVGADEEEKYQKASATTMIAPIMYHMLEGF